MANTDLTVDVDARLHVSDETARTALRLIDIWLNEDFSRCLVARTSEDGTVKHILSYLGNPRAGKGERERKEGHAND